MLVGKKIEDTLNFKIIPTGLFSLQAQQIYEKEVTFACVRYAHKLKGPVGRRLGLFYPTGLLNLEG